MRAGSTAAWLVGQGSAVRAPATWSRDAARSAPPSPLPNSTGMVPAVSPAKSQRRPRPPESSPRRLRVVHGRQEPDLAAAERAVADLLRALGKNTRDEHFAETPRRVATAYQELLTPREFDLTTFPNDEGYDELVLARDIPVHSLCQHHLLPFHGVAHVGYLPGRRILGLSKLAWVVELFSRDLQVQERLTKQVADWLQRHLVPQGVGVVIEAEHLCMSLRGVHATGSRTVTSAMQGALREDARSRAEFLALAGVTPRQR
jgi:GTP cyclohydrolase I